MKASDIKELRKGLKLSQTDFGKAIGASLRSVQNYEKGDTQPSADVLMKLIELNAKHNTHIDTKTTILNEPDAVWVDYSGFMFVPLVMHRAQAGFLNGYGDEEYYEELPKVPFEVDKEYKGRYLCFEVSGDSMDNNSPESLLEGDILLCREVQKHHWSNKLHINQWDFVLVHKDEGILVKRIVDHNTSTGDLTLHSLNEYYTDKIVNIKHLIAIFNVVDIKRSRRR